MKNTIIVLSILTIAAVLSACSKTAPAPKADYTAKPGEVVKIEVSAAGYTPKSIAVTKGASVKLAFLRKDADNCGDELVFPALNIKKRLPVGEIVEVEITPETAGEIKFACGMDMLRGKLIVTE